MHKISMEKQIQLHKDQDPICTSNIVQLHFESQI